MKRLNLLVLISLITGCLTFCDNASNANEQKQDKGKKKKEKKETASENVQVNEKWDMPDLLKEVSGIAYLSANRFACVEDESGTIYIYNTASAKIEKEIPFGEPGDYEGIALLNNTAYVVQSDGKIFEVSGIDSSSPNVKTHTTPLSMEQNVEGICYDKKQTRLLLAIKGAETNSEKYKGIYAFDLKTKKLQTDPVIKIDLTDPVFNGSSGKKPSNAIQPSEINIHPGTGDIYVLEGTKPKLLILNNSGKIKALYQLSSSQFSQPEGLAFSPEGELFIANEGKKENGNIVKVTVTNH